MPRARVSRCCQVSGEASSPTMRRGCCHCQPTRATRRSPGILDLDPNSGVVLTTSGELIQFNLDTFTASVVSGPARLADRRDPGARERQSHRGPTGRGHGRLSLGSKGYEFAEDYNSLDGDIPGLPSALAILEDGDVLMTIQDSDQVFEFTAAGPFEPSPAGSISLPPLQYGDVVVETSVPATRRSCWLWSLAAACCLAEPTSSKPASLSPVEARTRTTASKKMDRRTISHRRWKTYCGASTWIPITKQAMTRWPHNPPRRHRRRRTQLLDPLGNIALDAPNSGGWPARHMSRVRCLFGRWMVRAVPRLRSLVRTAWQSILSMPVGQTHPSGSYSTRPPRIMTLSRNRQLRPPRNPIRDCSSPAATSRAGGHRGNPFARRPRLNSLDQRSPLSMQTWSFRIRGRRSEGVSSLAAKTWRLLAAGPAVDLIFYGPALRSS